MAVSFEKRKKDCLSRKDKSNKSSWDKPIFKLCKKINDSNDYYTLSSCSGRIILIKDVVEKKHNLILFKSHNKLIFKQLQKALKEAMKFKGVVIFKQEPCILHVACRNLGSAEDILKKAREAGWKNSGIISIASNRIVCELRSTENLSLPIMNKGRLLVNDNFLKILIKDANSRLMRTWKKIKKLENLS